MNKYGQIVIIEDDHDDQDMLKEILLELEVENEISLFDNGEKALEYLRKDDVKPFLILCDINMPVIDGYSLKK